MADTRKQIDLILRDIELVELTQLEAGDKLEALIAAKEQRFVKEIKTKKIAGCAEHPFGSKTCTRWFECPFIAAHNQAIDIAIVALRGEAPASGGQQNGDSEGLHDAQATRNQVDNLRPESAPEEER